VKELSPAAVLQAVIESPEGIVIFALDRAYRYVVFNDNHARTMAKIWNAEIRVGVSMLDYITREDDRQRAKANFDRCLAGEAFRLEEAYGDEALDRREYEDVYSPIQIGDEVAGLTVFLTDITEKRNIERQLAAYRSTLEKKVEERTAELAAAHAQIVHTQKVESLGILAGGIAHDFNNILVGVLGCADLALAEMPAGAAGRELVEQIGGAARHAAELTAQMLAYAGKSPRKIGPVQINETIGHVTSFLRASIPKSVELNYDLAPSASTILADPTQVQQVLMNLVTNAAEAIGDVPGVVTIATQTRVLDRRALAATYLDDDLTPGEYLVLCVEDDGRGMDQATYARLFDPFFTTKVSGRGLGLASVIGIVRGHRGAIRVTSTPDEGSRFEVFLPVGGSCSAAANEEEAGEDSSAAPRRGPRMALVVDDEPVVREIASRMLQQIGFSVIAAEDGYEAVRRFEECGEQLSLVVLDMTMPRLGGEATLRRIRQLAPNVPVLLASGYPADHEKLAFMHEHAHVSFLHKPFDLAELDAAVALALRPGG
jgi:signal transduction histidine kinase/CheY-like chemotaxis protein